MYSLQFKVKTRCVLFHDCILRIKSVVAVHLELKLRLEIIVCDRTSLGKVIFSFAVSLWNEDK